MSFLSNRQVLPLCCIKVVSILILCIGALFTIAACEGVTAQEIQWSNKRSAPKIQSLVVPLRYKKHHIGEVAIRVYPSGKITVLKKQIDKALQPGLKPEHFATLLSKTATGSGYISLRELKSVGFHFRFDNTEVSLFAELTIDQLKTQELALSRRQTLTDSANAIKASDISASLNMFFGLDYVSQTLSGDTGIYNPRVDFESAINAHGFVIENEMTIEAGESGRSSSGIKRRGTRIVKDYTGMALRAKAGDVNSLFTSFQSSGNILGVSIEHNIARLNPGRNIRATSRRSFRIERDSDVQVMVNGRPQRSMRLQAGDYNLTDLAVTTGANNIHLIIKDDVGHKKTLKFTTFLDGRLLSPEISEWAVSAGTISKAGDGGPNYTTKPLVSGYYRTGFNEFLTAQAHLQGSDDVIMGGGGVLMGSSFGLINAEAAMSFAMGGNLGYAMKLDIAVDKNLLKFGGDTNRSLNLSAEYKSPDFAAAGELSLDDQEELLLSFGFSQQLFLDINASLSGNYQVDPDGQSYGANLSLSKQLTPNLNGGISLGYKFDENPVYSDNSNEFNAEIHFSYRLNENSGLYGTHDINKGSSSLTYQHQKGKGVGAWGATVSTEHNMDKGADNESSSISGALNYTGNRANYSLTHDTQFAGLGTTMEENRTSARMETSIAYAGGKIAVGRPVRGGFAILSPHHSIKDKQIVVNPDGDSVFAYSDWLGAVLVPNLAEYSTTRVTYDVDGVPVGYDLGAGAFDFKAPYKAGHSATVGSDYAVTAFGRMVNSEGEPTKLITGIAWQKSNPDRKVTIFTNNAGRFGAQGMAPGEWTIEMATTPLSRYKLIIPEGTSGLLKAGTLKPIN